MKAKRSSQRLPVPAKQNSTDTKKPRSTSRRTATHADKDPDAPVLIDPRYLVEHHGMSKNAATRIAKGALDICSKRWKRAEVRVSDDEIDYSHSFINIGYASKISQHDVDMEASNNSGPTLKAEIHDYLLIRACEEVGVRPPTFETARTLDPMEELSASWKGTSANEEYHLLATKAAWHAALLAGLRSFDRMAMGMSISKVRRSKFKKALSASLEKLMAGISKMESNVRRLVTELGIETGSTVTSEGDDMAEDAIRSYAMIAFSNAVESFARAYVFALHAV